MSDHLIPTEDFTPDEQRALIPYFTNLQGPVFALRNLPDEVKGALFARYSRSAKSLRRLFLDEFFDKVEVKDHTSTIGIKRAEELYDRVLSDYGDDSVAQLGGAHLACEGASNILTKVLEWGRLMAYLEQSTRYVPYTDRRGGMWKYLVPSELDNSPFRNRYIEVLDNLFETYTKWLEPIQKHYSTLYPKMPDDSVTVYKRTIRARALDTLRGLLPSATQSNVGIYGTGQAYESLLLKMRVHPLEEVRAYSDLMLTELRKVIPAFLKRVDQPHRGEVWSQYLAETQNEMKKVSEHLLHNLEPKPQSEVVLTDFDADGEIKVVATALYAVSDLPDDQLLDIVRRMTIQERETILQAYIGQRSNRRHKPGRALERASYHFDILTDYGAFRDLQRHRILTIEWQPLTTYHGYTTPDMVKEVGALSDWDRVMDKSADLYDTLSKVGLNQVASYVVPMAYKVRFYMHVNARELMHIIELRTSPQGHPSYRNICQIMHRLIAEKAGHKAIASAMVFADHSKVDLGRLKAERVTEERLQNKKG